MQGLFFRVDGADLETGEETYLVLQAPSSGHAEQIARRQGLLIASVRPATTADWGVSSSAAPAPAITETIVFEGVSSAAVQIVEPAAELASPVSSEPDSAIESGDTSAIFEDVETASGSSGAQDNLDSRSDALTGTFDVTPPVMDLATWMALRPPISAPESNEDLTLAVHFPAEDTATQSENQTPIDTSQPTPQDSPAIAVVSFDSAPPTNPFHEPLPATEAQPPQSEIEIHDDAAPAPVAAVSPAATNIEIDTLTKSPINREVDFVPTRVEITNETIAPASSPAEAMPTHSEIPDPPISSTPELHQETTHAVAPPPSSIFDVQDGTPAVSQSLPLSFHADDQAATPVAEASPSPTSKLSQTEDRANVSATPLRTAASNATAVQTENGRPKPRPVALASKPRSAVGAMVPAVAGSVPKPPAPKPLPATEVFTPRIPSPKTQPAPGVRRVAATVMSDKAAAASRAATTSRPGGIKTPAKAPVTTTARAAPRPAASAGAASARPAGSSAAAPASRTVLPPRPLPPVVPPQRPTRLTPPTIKRIPPVMPPPAVVAELPASPAPVDIPAPQIEETPPSIDAIVPPPALEPMPGMLDALESTPIMETFHDLAPVAAESQRVSGDVVGGSEIGQVVTKIAWDQTAHAVEHSSGSALERLASAATASYPPDPRFDDPFSAIPAAEPAAVSDIAAYPAATDHAPAAIVEEVAAPLAAVAEPFPQASHATATGYATPALAGSNSMLPVFYILAPLAILISGAGIGLAVWSMLRVAPADLEDIARLDFRITALTQTLLGGMAFLGGLLLFVCATLAYLAGAVRSGRSN